MEEPLIQGGYVIIARQLRKSKLWLSLKSAHRLVMIEILLQAQWQDCDVVRNGEIIHLKRGQVATSYQQIVDDISEKNITIKVVRTALDKMERAHFLAKDEAVQRAKKGLLLTIVKYDFYQNQDNYKGKADGNAKANARAEQGQSEGRARAINKHLKHLKHVNKDNIYSIFDFWNTKKIVIHKQLMDATSSSIHARLEVHSMEVLLEAIENYHACLIGKEYYYTHKFALKDFMNPKNLDKFLTENNPFETFKDRSKKGKQQNDIYQMGKELEAEMNES